MAEMITIGCKLPHGIVAQVSDTQIHINGANSSQVIGGYGQTVVDKSFYEQWASIYKDAAFFVNELVFIVKDARSFKDAATERQDVATGVEGVNPDKPGLGIKEDTEAKSRRKTVMQ